MKKVPSICGVMLLLVLQALPMWSAAAESQVLAGRVIDETGAALAGSNVFVRDLKTGLEIATVADGEGAFQVEVRPGKYRVTAARAQFATQSQVVEVPSPEAQNLSATLVPAPLVQQVVVSGSREEELIENSVTKVDVVSRTMIKDSGYERVSDLLSEEPGVIVRSGSSGNRSETQIQGIDSRQSLVLIDGYPVVGARGIKRGILNMDRQSAGRLERIEVVKGASSALYGSEAIGGVINMITREAPRKFDGNVTTSAGSFNGVDLRGDVGFRHQGWHGFFDVERHKRNPYRLIPGDFSTTAAGFHRYDYFGKMGYDFSERLKVGLMANAFDNDELGRFYGELGPQTTATKDSAQNYGLNLDLGLTSVTQWTFRGYYGKYDESSKIAVLAMPGEIDTNANLNQRLYRLETNISHVWGSRQLVQGGVEWNQDNYRGFNRVVGDNAGQQISMVDTWFNDRIELHPRVSLTLGARWNDHSLYGDKFVPRAGALVRVTDDLRLRGSWGRGFRAPDLGQLYFRFLNPTNFYQVIGNPSLVPETSTTNQVGFDYRLDRVRFSGTYFRNDIKNLIQADLIGRPSTPQALRGLLNAFNIDSAFNPGLHRLFYLYRNVDNVYTTGVEGKVELNLTRNLIVSSSYTYLDARDKGTKAFLSQRHRHHGNFRVWWSTSRWGGLRTNFRGTYFSKWPIAGRSGSFIGDGYQVWDWYVAKPVAAGSEVYFALDNLFDSTDSNLHAAEPSFFRADPGRTFRVGMRWNFARE